MLGLGRNNFGLNIVHFSPDRFVSERKTKKQLKKVCGSKYPVSVKALMKQLKNSHCSHVMLALNSRGVKILTSVLSYEPHFDQIDSDHWCVPRNSTPTKQVWRWMRDHHKDNFKMKEPK